MKETRQFYLFIFSCHWRIFARTKTKSIAEQYQVFISCGHIQVSERDIHTIHLRNMYPSDKNKHLHLVTTRMSAMNPKNEEGTLSIVSGRQRSGLYITVL